MGGDHAVTPEKQDREARTEEQKPAPLQVEGPLEMDPGWEAEFLDERATALHRTTLRLRRMLKELKAMEGELDRLDLTQRLPGLSARRRRDLQCEIDLSVDAYNYLREAASCSFRQLIQQRESFGFRGHELVHRCYHIPELLLPPDTFEEILEA